jgi:vancomycin permeability regulator SanA
MRATRRLLSGLTAALVAAVGLVETAHWAAQGNRGADSDTGTCAVLVLGYPSEPDGSVHPVQRLRVAAGVEAYRTHACSRIVLSGGAVQTGHVEAETMARIARELAVPASDLVLEDQARSTWENVGCGLRRLGGFDRIFVASDSLHARRGVRYLCRQAPDLCARTFAAGGYESFALLWWKLPAALYELRARVRDRVFYERNEEANAAACPEPRA